MTIDATQCLSIRPHLLIPDPNMRRHGRKLLSVVKGQPHATADDHIQDDPSPPKRRKIEAHAEDFNQDPVSSSEEEEDEVRRNNEKSSLPAPAPSITTTDEAVASSPRKGARARRTDGNKPAAKRAPPSKSYGKSSRGISGQMDGGDESEDDEVFKEDSKARSGRTYGGTKQSLNFHTQARQSPKKPKKEISKDGPRFRKPSDVGGDLANNPTAGSISRFQKPTSIAELSSGDDGRATPSKTGFAVAKAIPEDHNTTSRTFQPPRNTRSSRRTTAAETAEQPPPRKGLKTVESLNELSSGLSNLNKDASWKMPDTMDDDGRRCAPQQDANDPILLSSQVDADHEASEDISVDMSDGEGTTELDVDSTSSTFKCPLCEESTPFSVLDAFRAAQKDEKKLQKRMTINQQAAFCRFHKHASAREAWTAAGYPTIDWAALPSRIATPELLTKLRAIITGSRPSAFRSALVEKLATGRHRNLAQSLQTAGDAALSSLVPGYYGGRGAKMFAEAVMREFAELIRQRMDGDEVIGAAGVAGFVQAVLVPEVGVALVVEDMDVDEKRAVTILQESAGLGELLWEGEDDGTAYGHGGGTQW